MQKKVDANLKKAVSLNHIMITCGSMNEILVNWKQPNGNIICSVYPFFLFLESEKW